MRKVYLFILFSITLSTNVFSQNDTTIIVNDPDKPAEFTGGPQAWRRFLEQNTSFEAIEEMRAPEGVYRVEVKFIVHESGRLDSLRAVTSIGYGMEAEFMRILKKSPKWTPAEKDGKPVSTWTSHIMSFAIHSDMR
jgi:protein TonB